MTVNLQLIIELCNLAVINYHQEVFLATSYSFDAFVVIDMCNTGGPIFVLPCW
jgi:hypothetical protein